MKKELNSFFFPDFSLLLKAQQVYNKRKHQ